ncbi:tigger transposable element-derived protein 6-like [Uloborus diversus]|uniref:tigger transposable element-derived protein 6-like n=1 Tax=Uloborus diversus TaxID=327109 RepID=UPI002409FCCC|nr:tigger transposable element-derived protein 6-like [Uloborus diversus]
MDQCPAHPKDLPSLNNIKVTFFPANCTSKLQPMDLSIIHCVKVHYKKNLVRRLLAAVEMKRSVKEHLRTITVLDAIHIVCLSWASINETCIKNCFKKAGFLFPEGRECEDDKEAQSKAEVSKDDWNAVSGGQALCTFSEFVDVDETLITTEMRDIRDISAEIADNQDKDVVDNEEEDAAKLLGDA